MSDMLSVKYYYHSTSLAIQYFISYQHVSEAPAFSTCGTESAYHGLEETGLSRNHHGSEPAFLPEASVRSRRGSWHESEPAVLGMGQLQRNFESMSMSFDEEDEDKEKAFIPKRPPNWALSKEFVPRETSAGRLPAELLYILLECSQNTLNSSTNLQLSMCKSIVLARCCISWAHHFR